MVRCASLFSQLLSLFPRTTFERIVREVGSERYAKGFSSWDQFVAMLFCQLGQAHSLREICGGLQTIAGKICHLGMGEAPKRSTLSYANQHRPWELQEGLFYEFLGHCQASMLARKKFRFKNKLLSLDSTVISLCLKLFGWAQYRQTKGAVKLHLLLDHDGYLPVFADLTKGKVHDVKVAQRLTFPKGSILVMDRGYCDYALFARLTNEGVYFVSRLKDNARYEVIETRTPLPSHRILSDEIIVLSSLRGQQQCEGLRFRRIVVDVPEKGTTLVLLSNHLDFGPTTIADIYKDRWQIEVFFRAIKQNLRIKTFVGTSENALRTQIWTALIAILLLKYLAHKSKIAWALSTLVAFLRWNLFSYRKLWDWLDDPFDPPVAPQGAIQLALDFGQHTAP